MSETGGNFIIHDGKAYPHCGFTDLKEITEDLLRQIAFHMAWVHAKEFLLGVPFCGGHIFLVVRRDSNARYLNRLLTLRQFRIAQYKQDRINAALLYEGLPF